MINWMNPFNGNIVGKTANVGIKADKKAGAKNTEYLSGKAGMANFQICSSKDNGFSLVTDKGYLSVSPEGQIYYCKTVDDNGKKRTLNLYS